MLIPLGFLAASGVSAGSFDLLETQILGSSQASVTFSSLSTYASTYQHLQIRAVARTAQAQAASVVYLDFNGGAGTFGHYLLGDGSSVSSDDADSRAGFVTGSSASASAFGGMVIDILDPFETTKNKTIRSLSTGLGIYLQSSLWVNTAAITTLTLRPPANFVTGSRFSLYGLKAA
jgi:hypothetical protein